MWTRARRQSFTNLTNLILKHRFSANIDCRSADLSGGNQLASCTLQSSGQTSAVWRSGRISCFCKTKRIRRWYHFCGCWCLSRSADVIRRIAVGHKLRCCRQLYFWSSYSPSTKCALRRSSGWRGEQYDKSKNISDKGHLSLFLRLYTSNYRRSVW